MGDNDSDGDAGSVSSSDDENEEIDPRPTTIVHNSNNEVNDELCFTIHDISLQLAEAAYETGTPSVFQSMLQQARRRRRGTQLTRQQQLEKLQSVIDAFAVQVELDWRETRYAEQMERIRELEGELLLHRVEYKVLCSLTAFAERRFADLRAQVAALEDEIESLRLEREALLAESRQSRVQLLMFVLVQALRRKMLGCRRC